MKKNIVVITGPQGFQAKESFKETSDAIVKHLDSSSKKTLVVGLPRYHTMEVSQIETRKGLIKTLIEWVFG